MMLRISGFIISGLIFFTPLPLAEALSLKISTTSEGSLMRREVTVADRGDVDFLNEPAALLVEDEIVVLRGIFRNLFRLESLSNRLPASVNMIFRPDWMAD